MTTPLTTAISSSVIKLLWDPPTEKQIRGEVIKYQVYQMFYSDLKQSPFAPPTYWKVSFVLKRPLPSLKN